MGVGVARRTPNAFDAPCTFCIEPPAAAAAPRRASATPCTSLTSHIT